MQLQWAPWSYELTYRLWYKMPSTWGFIVRLDTLVAGRRLRRAITDMNADVVVSTYPLASLVLGHMRKKRWLKVPVVTYLTDFAVHPLWVHPDVDVHLAVSAFAADTARARGGDDSPRAGPARRRALPRASRATAPRSAPSSVSNPTRTRCSSSRARGASATSSAPSRPSAQAGDFHPIMVCGRDDKLRAELEGSGYGTVLGWTDEMPALMDACDVLVENAGGLTAMEAFAVGLPVITFQPIAGHGKDNAESMAELGVNCYARDDDELRAALTDLTVPGPDRSAPDRAAPTPCSSRDPADDVVELAAALRERTRGSSSRSRCRAAAAPRTGRRGERARALRRAHARRPGGRRASASAWPSRRSTAHDRVYLGVRLDGRRARRARRAVRARPARRDGDRRRHTVRTASESLDGHARRARRRHRQRGLGQVGPFRPLRAQSDVVDDHGPHPEVRRGPAARVRARAALRRLRPVLLAPPEAERLVRADHVVRPERDARAAAGPGRSTCSTVAAATRWPMRGRGAPTLARHVRAARAHRRGRSRRAALSAAPRPPSQPSAPRAAVGAAAFAVSTPPRAARAACRRSGVRFTPAPRRASAAGHVALTFDDGPDPASTPGFLDVLDALGWRATFFMLGEMVATRAGLAARGRRRRSRGRGARRRAPVNMLRRTPGHARDDIAPGARHASPSATGVEPRLVPAAVRHPRRSRRCGGARGSG